MGKLRPNCVNIQGVHVADIDDETARKIGTHKGVRIIHVTKNTPGWDADLLCEDVITHVDDRVISDNHALDKIFFKETGPHSLTIIRGSEHLKKVIDLLPMPEVK